MKKVLLDSNKKFFKGNMHCHSNLSDAVLSPKELKELYKSNGYSFLAITDHDLIYDHSDLDDKDFITITSMECSIKEFPEQSTLVNTNMKVCHINFYAKNQHNTNNFCYYSKYDKYSSIKQKQQFIEKFGEYEREYSAKGINKLISDGKKNGFFACYNHPRWSLENYREYGKYKGFWGVEIYNHSCANAGHYEYDINVLDDFLRDNKKVFASCGDDNHNHPTNNDSFGAFVMVNAKSLSYKNIINGLLKGNFYSSQGPTIKSLMVEDNLIKIECSNAKSIALTTKGRIAKIVHANTSEGICYAEFPFSDRYGYFRIDVIDEKGLRANTQAYDVKLFN